MIKRFVPLVRRSLTYRPAAGFCLYKGYLDPHKHNTMNHNIHNVYIELYDVGVYPEWVVNQSEPARTYEQELRSLVVQVLKKDHPQLTVDYIHKNNHRSWDQALGRLYPGRKLTEQQKNFGTLMHSILNKLALNVIVKQSKWTWIKEQEERLRFTTKFFEEHQVQSIEQFFQAYNLCIETLTNISNFGLAKDILHDNSYLEKAIIAESNNEDPVGIKDLEQNPNVINRFLAFIHKI